MDSDLGEMVFAAEKLLKKRLRNEKGATFSFFIKRDITTITIIYEKNFLSYQK